LEVLHHIAELRARLNSEPRVVLVPTMGNLHAGHISLVDLARWRGGCVVATIFVNRLQFEPGGDFDRYPRSLAHDTAMLEAAGCDVVFAPDEQVMYPEPQEVRVTPPSIARELEGAFRPGHFEGVATVVAKLLEARRRRLRQEGLPAARRPSRDGAPARLRHRDRRRRNHAGARRPRDVVAQRLPLEG